MQPSNNPSYDSLLTSLKGSLSVICTKHGGKNFSKQGPETKLIVIGIKNYLQETLNEEEQVYQKNNQPYVIASSIRLDTLLDQIKAFREMAKADNEYMGLKAAAIINSFNSHILLNEKYDFNKITQVCAQHDKEREAALKAEHERALKEEQEKTERLQKEEQEKLNLKKDIAQNNNAAQDFSIQQTLAAVQETLKAVNVELKSVKESNATLSKQVQEVTDLNQSLIVDKQKLTNKVNETQKLLEEKEDLHNKTIANLQAKLTEQENEHERTLAELQLIKTELDDTKAELKLSQTLNNGTMDLEVAPKAAPAFPKSAPVNQITHGTVLGFSAPTNTSDLAKKARDWQGSTRNSLTTPLKKLIDDNSISASEIKVAAQIIHDLCYKKVAVSIIFSQYINLSDICEALNSIITKGSQIPLDDTSDKNFIRRAKNVTECQKEKETFDNLYAQGYYPKVEAPASTIENTL